jgi:hypothetical protein
MLAPAATPRRGESMTGAQANGAAARGALTYALVQLPLGLCPRVFPLSDCEGNWSRQQVLRLNRCADYRWTGSKLHPTMSGIRVFSYSYKA